MAPHGAVDNNVWIVGDESKVIVIDAAHDVEKIAFGIGGRRVVAVVCTHARRPRQPGPSAVGPVQRPGSAPPGGGAAVGDVTHPDPPAGPGGSATCCAPAGSSCGCPHTPGHSPGSTCLYAPERGTVFTGDTLFQGGPDATGRSSSSFDTIIESIRDKLLTLPADTTLGTEAAHLEEWIARRR
jgi:hypothetical protein